MSRYPRCFGLIVLMLTVTAITMLMAGCSSSSPPPISVSISPSSPKSIDQPQTVALTANVANDSSFAGVTWSLTGQGTLTGASTTSVTYNSPTSTLSKAIQVTVTATSIKDSTKSASLQITVNLPPEIPFVQTIAAGTVGAPYSQTIEVVGGSAPFQWSVYDGPIETGWMVGGSVPDGLTLNATTGTISGTPTAAGTWYFEAWLTDATGVSAYAPFLSIQINSNANPGNPVPFLNQTLVPTAVSPGGSGLTLQVSGTGFVQGAAVDFNNAALTTTFVDRQHLMATVPAANVATAGTASITVVNPTPGGGRSNPVFFQVGAPQATVTFVNAANSPLQVPEPFALSVADFNEDGKPDLAIAANVRMYVMLGNGDGTFTAATGSPVPIPSPPYDDFGSPYTGPGLAVGDFNNSGHAGLAVGLFQNEAAAILFGKGDGTFTYSSTLAYFPQASTMSITAADFNGDGYLDLVAVNTLNGVSPVVVLGYGDGAFNSVTQNIQVSGDSSAAGDFNGDGKLDLALSGPNILTGNGDGTFTQGPVLNAGTWVAVGDFNGDGKLDIAVCYDNPVSTVAGTVTILLGDGTGNFTTAPGSPITVGINPWAIVTGDFNNDGNLDLAIANNANPGTVTLLLGNGDGTFTQASGSPYTVGQNPSAIAAADFNGDGKLDLAVANSGGTGTVSILLQQ